MATWGIIHIMDTEITDIIIHIRTGIHTIITGEIIMVVTRCGTTTEIIAITTEVIPQ